MKIQAKIATAALLAAAGFLFGSAGASAAIVCNKAGDCWHAQPDYAFRPEFGVVVHPDGWTWKQGEAHRWREHAGRGYWQGDNWREF